MRGVRFLLLVGELTIGGRLRRGGQQIGFTEVAEVGEHFPVISGPLGQHRHQVLIGARSAVMSWVRPGTTAEVHSGHFLMVIVTFRASLWTGDPALVEGVLRSWLPVGDLHMKDRRGFETHYEMPGLELTCHETLRSGSLNSFLLEGHIDGLVHNAVVMLRKLREGCRFVGVDFSGEYQEVDEDENPMSAERDIE